MNAHKFQVAACEKAKRPILNAASKEDPAELGRKFGATNLDLLDFDLHTNTNLKSIPNFVQGDVLTMSTLFKPNYFNTIVLGEFLEHCVFGAAEKAFQECHKLLPPDGVLIVTFPLDDRPAGVQQAAEKHRIWLEGETGHDITSYHQTVWEPEPFARLLVATGWRIQDKHEIGYSFVNRKPAGFGLVLKRA